jgi:hypothetical protein
MATHPLLTRELAIARRDQLRHDATAARAPKPAEGEVPADIRWIRRFIRVEETRCCCGAESSTW